MHDAQRLWAHWYGRVDEWVDIHVLERFVARPKLVGDYH